MVVHTVETGTIASKILKSGDILTHINGEKVTSKVTVREVYLFLKMFKNHL